MDRPACGCPRRRGGRSRPADEPMNAFPIGISAIAAGNRALDLIGQNIANATTPGYHRQIVNLVSRTTDGVTGSGVDVASLTRYDAPPIRTAILRGNADTGATTARL